MHEEIGKNILSNKRIYKNNLAMRNGIQYIGKFNILISKGHFVARIYSKTVLLKKISEKIYVTIGELV